MSLEDAEVPPAPAPAPERRRRFLLPIAIGVSVAATGLSLFLPWGRSGRTDRSSFDLVESALRLDLVDISFLGQGWFLVPLLASLSLLTLAVGRWALGAALALIVGMSTFVVAQLAHDTPVETRYGLWVAMILALVTVVLSLVCLSRKAHSHLYARRA